jgi:hypothetical protein
MSAGSRRSSKSVNRWGKLIKDHAKLNTAPPEEPKISQRAFDQTTKERDELKKNFEAAQKENAKLRWRIYEITKKVMDTANPTPFRTGKEKDPGDVSEVELFDMLDTLVPIEHNVSLEARLEELETRITLLNGEVGKLLKLKMSMENSLRGLDTCRDLEDMRRTVRTLWLQSCEYYQFD